MPGNTLPVARHSGTPQLWNTRKVASKLTTSSCSNAAVGEKVARTTIEPTSPHSRHARRGQHDQQRDPRSRVARFSFPTRGGKACLLFSPPSVPTVPVRWCALDVERRAVSNGTPSVTWHARRVEIKSIRTKKAMVSKRASFGRLPDLLATSMAKGGEGASTLRQRRKRGRMTCVPLALNALQSSQSC